MDLECVPGLLHHLGRKGRRPAGSGGLGTPEPYPRPAPRRRAPSRGADPPLPQAVGRKFRKLRENGRTDVFRVSGVNGLSLPASSLSRGHGSHGAIHRLWF